MGEYLCTMDYVETVSWTKWLDTMGLLTQLILDSGNLSLEATRGREGLLGHWHIPIIGTECDKITKETSNGAEGL